MFGGPYLFRKILIPFVAMIAAAFRVFHPRDPTAFGIFFDRTRFDFMGLCPMLLLHWTVPRFEISLGFFQHFLS